MNNSDLTPFGPETSGPQVNEEALEHFLENPPCNIALEELQVSLKSQVDIMSRLALKLLGG